MRPRTCMLSAFALSAALSLSTAALAGDLPKEGTFTATYSGFGTYKDYVDRQGSMVRLL